MVLTAAVASGTGYLTFRCVRSQAQGIIHVLRRHRQLYLLGHDMTAGDLNISSRAAVPKSGATWSEFLHNLAQKGAAHRHWWMWYLTPDLGEMVSMACLPPRVHRAAV
jgi:hypothetical protein